MLSVLPWVFLLSEKRRVSVHFNSLQSQSFHALLYWELRCVFHPLCLVQNCVVFMNIIIGKQWSSCCPVITSKVSYFLMLMLFTVGEYAMKIFKKILFPFSFSHIKYPCVCTYSSTLLSFFCSA